MSGDLIQRLRRLESGFSALCGSQADADALFREAKHFSTVAESYAVLPEATRCAQPSSIGHRVDPTSLWRQAVCECEFSSLSKPACHAG